MIIRETGRIKKGPLVLAMVIFLTMIPGVPVRAEEAIPGGDRPERKDISISFENKEITYILGENDLTVSDCKIKEAEILRQEK